MMPDVKTVDLREPKGEDLVAVCRMLAEVWPQERWLWDALAAGSIDLYRWKSLALFAGGEVMGHAARMDCDIYLNGAPATVSGVASVATPERFRRMGVARRLMAALLDDVDRAGVPSVLFTGLPRVYEPHEFRVLPQRYVDVAASRVPVHMHGCATDAFASIDAAVRGRMEAIYSGAYPDYDGKVRRDADYWPWYADLFNHGGTRRILFCRDGERDVGYVRAEAQRDRLLVSECCAPPDAPDVHHALLSLAHRAAASQGLGTITLALPPAHFLRGLLDALHVPTTPTPDSAFETFMLRDGASGNPPGIDGLQWSLADKF